MHLLKIALGTGIFAMPNAFNHAGYLVGLIIHLILLLDLYDACTRFYIFVRPIVFSLT